MKWRREVDRRIKSVQAGFRITGWVAAPLAASEDYDVPLACGVHVASIEPLGLVTAGVWTRTVEEISPEGNVAPHGSAGDGGTVSGGACALP